MKAFFIRCEEDRAGQFTRAAKSQGKTVSAWLFDLAVEAIAPPKPTVSIWPNPMQAVEVVQTGQEPTKQKIGIDAREWLAARGNTITDVCGAAIDLGDAPAEDVKTRPWLPELIRLAKMGEMDPGSAQEEMNSLLKSDQFRPPKGWMNMDMRTKAKWLDEHKPLIQEGEW